MILTVTNGYLNKYNCILGIEAVISKSTDYDELMYVWKAWRDASGAKIKQQFNTYVELSNEAARENGKLNHFIKIYGVGPLQI